MGYKSTKCGIEKLYSFVPMTQLRCPTIIWKRLTRSYPLHFAGVASSCLCPSDIYTNLYIGTKNCRPNMKLHNNTTQGKNLFVEPPSGFVFFKCFIYLSVMMLTINYSYKFFSLKYIFCIFARFIQLHKKYK